MGTIPKKHLVQKRLIEHNCIFTADVDITVDEWKEILANHKIFDKRSLDMIHKWYAQIDHQSTSKEMLNIYRCEYPQHKLPPFNGIVKGLGIRILKYLNRFEIIDDKGRKSYFIILFEGWHEGYKKSGAFVWKLRDELVLAIEELQLFDEALITIDNELENTIYPGGAEGKKAQYFTTKYERSQKNRDAAIQIHKPICCVCGFNFENKYGELGRNYIEVHHLKPLYNKDEIIVVDPKTDLVCVCSNCHRMLHRKKDRIITPDELKLMLQ